MFFKEVVYETYKGTATPSFEEASGNETNPPMVAGVPEQDTEELWNNSLRCSPTAISVALNIWPLTQFSGQCTETTGGALPTHFVERPAVNTLLSVV